MRADKRQSVALILLAAVCLFLLRVVAAKDPLSDAFNTAFKPLAQVGRFITYEAETSNSNEIMNSKVAELQVENAALREQLGLVPLSGYTTQTAQVIGKNVEVFRQILRLDKGQAAGLQVNMPVLDQGSQQLIGRIRSVDANTAEVVLIGDPDFRAAAVVGSTTAEGIIRTEAGALLLDTVNRQDQDLSSQPITTSGLGGLFPPGLFIGQINSEVSEPDSIFARYSVDYQARYASIRFVSVITGVEP
jgi:rod shape-determining protein MreC